MGNLEEKEVLSAVRRAAAEAPEEARAVMDALSEGMDTIGQRFDRFEYLIADLIFAGELFTEALEILRPVFPAAEPARRKKVILATVEGDLHDIGKNIVRTVLEAKGFTVIDLGVNVSPDVIVQRTAEEGARLVALSAVLTVALETMKNTVEAFESAGMRGKVSIVVGGACVNENIARRMKADYYGRTPEETAEFCLRAE